MGWIEARRTMDLSLAQRHDISLSPLHMDTVHRREPSSRCPEYHPPIRYDRYQLSAHAPHVANFLISDMFNGSLLPLLVNYLSSRLLYD